ncbi:hypothetical protein D9M70_307880 [compost metagenome]
MGAFLEDVVDPPHVPHALGEVRIEVAVVDGVAGYAVAVAGTAVGDLVGVGATRADGLGVHVVGVVVVGVEQPLVRMQVEDVVFVALVGVVDLDEVTDVAVVDVGRLGRVQRHARLDADGFRRRRLAGRQGFQADVGRDVHQHAGIAHGMRAEEELLVGAGQAVVHRPDAQAVADQLGADGVGAVVDEEGIAGRLQHVAEHRVRVEARERLGDHGLVLEHHGEVAEGFQAVGQRRVALALALQRVGGRREAAVGLRAHDHRIAVAGDDLAAVDHVDDRQPGPAFADPRLAVRVARLVVDHRLAGGGAAGGGQAHLFLGEGVAVGAAFLRQHHHLGEQAVADVAGTAFATEAGGRVADGEGAFALGVEGVAAAAARQHHVIAVAADVAGDILDGIHRLHAVDVEADVAVGDLVVGFQRQEFRLVLFQPALGVAAVGVGLQGQEVLQVHLQALAGGQAQHQRARTLVRAQADPAGNRRAAAAQGHALVVHHVAAQGVHHAVDVLRAHAVEHERLVERDHVGDQGAFAAGCRLRFFRLTACEQKRQGHQSLAAPAGKDPVPESR